MGEPLPFHQTLDELDVRRNWGQGSAESATEDAAQFAVPRIETLVAGFSNACHLRCPFCYETHYGRDLVNPQSLDIDKLIRLINRHKETTGQNIEYFRVGNTGEPLINTKLIRLLTETADSVNWYSIISSLSVKNERLLAAVEDHPKVNMIHVSCDCSDAASYAQLRTNGDFELVWQNIARFKRSGRYLVLNAVALEQNAASLRGLPRRMADYGVDELHIFYPLNTNEDLSNNALGKAKLQAFSELYRDIRAECERHRIVLRTDPWVYHPQMVGIIEDIDTPELYAEYQRYPCDWQWMLILHPDGTYHHCSVQNNLGVDLPPGQRPFDTASSLLDLANSPQSLAFRGLHLDGRFPAPCRRICHKRGERRSPQATQMLFSLKYDDSGQSLSIDQFVKLLDEQHQKLAIRAFSPAVRRALTTRPELSGHVEVVIDKNPLVTDQFPVVGPDQDLERFSHCALLLGSNRSSVFNHAARLAEHHEQIFKIVIVGNDAANTSFRRLK